MERYTGGLEHRLKYHPDKINDRQPTDEDCFFAFVLSVDDLLGAYPKLLQKLNQCKDNCKGVLLAP